MAVASGGQRVNIDSSGTLGCLLEKYYEDVACINYLVVIMAKQQGSPIK